MDQEYLEQGFDSITDALEFFHPNESIDATIETELALRRTAVYCLTRAKYEIHFAEMSDTESEIFETRADLSDTFLQRGEYCSQLADTLKETRK